VRLNRIAGPGFAAIGRDGLHNVLILPDGFVDDPQGSDRAAFERYARQLVTLLTTDERTRPFDVLADKFNYFTAWVPSPQAGISTMSEQRTVIPVDDNVRGRDVELPERFDVDTPPNEFTIEQLIWAVGLPSPVFDPDNSDSGDDDQGRIHDWAQVYGPYVTEARVTDVYDDWNSRADRALINEVDTAFHVANDYRPRVDGPNSTNLEFHPLRMTQKDFNTFIGTPQERLAAKAARITIDNQLKRLAKLPIMEQGRVWLAAASGEDVEPLLPPDPGDDLPKTITTEIDPSSK